MADERSDTSQEATGEARPPQHERGIPSVAGNSKGVQVFGVAVMGVTLVAVLFLLFNDDPTVGGKQGVRAEEEYVPQQVGEVPELPSLPEPEPDPEPDSELQPKPEPQQTADTGPSPDELAARRAALRRLREHRKEMEARRRSPMLLVNKGNAMGAGTRPVMSTIASAAGSGGQQGGGLPSAFGDGGSGSGGTGRQLSRGSVPGSGPRSNTAPSGSEGYAERTKAFAEQVTAESVATARARQLPNMDRRINQGKVIRAVLETAISSDLPGQMRAVVTEPVYSADGSNALITAGSRLIGEYRSGLVRGQTRVFVIWTRLIRPDGVSVRIDSPGTDALGRAGLDGDVDTHFFERFGAAVLLSMIGSGVEIAQRGNEVVLNTSESFQSASQAALQSSIDIPPTIHVPQGRPIQVFVDRDLTFTQLATRR